MAKKLLKGFFSLSDFKFKNKVVLVRVDFNVPLGKKGEIKNDKKLRASLPTIDYLIRKKARIVLMSHLGRPEGNIVQKLKMNIVARRLQKLLKRKVFKLDDCIGSKVENFVSTMAPEEVLLLENLRFYKEEKENDSGFAQSLAAFADFYINDAFAASHNAHASIISVPIYLPACAGLLLEKEISKLSLATLKPKKPFVAIIGGAKISSKLRVIKSLLRHVDYLLLGGAMIFTFYKAQGYEIGKSLLEPDFVAEAKKLLKNKKLILPVDILAASKIDSKAKTKLVSTNEIPKSWIGLDLGPKSIRLFQNKLKNAKTIVWNGPLGYFEISKFAKATNIIAKELAKSKAITIIGGGDSAAAIEKINLEKKMTHVSTGGGASLKFLEGESLPGIKALKDSQKKFKSLIH